MENNADDLRLVAAESSIEGLARELRWCADMFSRLAELEQQMPGMVAEDLDVGIDAIRRVARAASKRMRDLRELAPSLDV